MPCPQRNGVGHFEVEEGGVEGSGGRCGGVVLWKKEVLAKAN